jgi:hypothetical protein
MHQYHDWPNRRRGYKRQENNTHTGANIVAKGTLLEKHMTKRAELHLQGKDKPMRFKT